MKTVSKHFVYYPFYFLVGGNFRSMRRHFEKIQWLPYDRLYDMQWQRLKRMLEYAYENIPFYRSRFEDYSLHPSDIRSSEDLLRLPLLTKDNINRDMERHASVSRTRAFPRHTSGSSGTPLRILKDGEAMTVMDAIMYRNYGWFDIGIGDRQAKYWGSPLGRYGRGKAKLKDIMLNRIRFSPFKISDDYCGRFAEQLMRYRPTYIYGYAQTVFKFSEYVARENIDLSGLGLKAVIVTGEMISEEQVKTVEDAFKCRVSNEYGCTETGIIAMECPEKGMHLMIENLFIEFIKDGGHAAPGEEGEIVVTELYGNLMPLIRYQVGDIGTFRREMCGCGRGLPLMGRLRGRNDEFIICPGGRQVDPIIFEYVLKEIPEGYGKITQFKVVQEEDLRLEIEACYNGNRAREMVREVKGKLAKAVGEGLKINLRLVDSIEAEASGKLRCFISRVKR